MKITINYDDGAQSVFYKMTPMQFAQAILEAAIDQSTMEAFAFQDRDTIDDAVRQWNVRRMIA